MDKPLLTIAIPTWNRAVILDKALTALLPQLLETKEKIEIVVCDNASSDKTKEIIEKHILKFITLNIIYFKQRENTGYFGNFQKCRELSNGEYFWLLSDNDFVSKGLIKHLLKSLTNHEPSFVFLSDWVHSNNFKIGIDFRENIYLVKNAIEKFNYKLTLISAVIFKNNKRNDDVFFDKFKGNSFIGFAYFLESLKSSEQAIEITGTSLFIHDSKVSFNAFRSFAVDLIACLEYAKKEKIISERTVDFLVNSAISELIIKYYIFFRITGKLHGVKYKRQDINSILTIGFSGYKTFDEELKLLINSNKLRFYKLVIFKHFYKIIKQILNR